MDDLDASTTTVKRQLVNKAISNKKQRFLDKVSDRTTQVLRSVALKSLKSAALLLVAKYRKRYARAPAKPLQCLPFSLKIQLLQLIGSNSVQTKPSCEVTLVDDYFLVLSQLLDCQTLEIELSAEPCLAPHRLLRLLEDMCPLLKKLSLCSSRLEWMDLRSERLLALLQLQHLTELRLFGEHFCYDWQLAALGYLPNLQHLQLDALSTSVSPLSVVTMLTPLRRLRTFRFTVALSWSGGLRRTPSTGYFTPQIDSELRVFERGARSKLMSVVLLMFPRLEVIGVEVTERGDSHFSLENGIGLGQPKMLRHLSVYADDFEDSEHVNFELLFPEATAVKIVSCYNDEINFSCINQLVPLLKKASTVSLAVLSYAGWAAKFCTRSAILHMLPLVNSNLSHLSLDMPCCCEFLLRRLFTFCHKLQHLDVRIYQGGSTHYNSTLPQLPQDTMPVEAGSLQHLRSFKIARSTFHLERSLPRELMLSILCAPKMEHVKLVDCNVASRRNLVKLRELLSTGSIFTNLTSFEVRIDSDDPCIRSSDCEAMQTQTQNMKKLTRHVCELAEKLVKCHFKPLDAKKDSLLVAMIAEVNKRREVEFAQL